MGDCQTAYYTAYYGGYKFLSLNVTSLPFKGKM